MKQNNNRLHRSPNKTRGAAIRAARRNKDDADKLIIKYLDSGQELDKRANVVKDPSQKLKITFLGGQEGIGEKNMQILEWQNDAIVIDCGIDLSVDLPGINYAIADPTYLESIKHKIKGYIISHGHLDHIGGLKHIVPNIPAPIYGSGFTNGIVQKTFEDINSETGSVFEPTLITMNMDTHERLSVGVFTIELVRITHSIPESSCIVVDTPVGRIVNTGDFRLDPEPLDNMPSDITRLRKLGDEGVLVLMSESTYADIPGRQQTEHTLQDSFSDLIGNASGRVFVSIFSSNMNRVQMIINAAVASNRHIALDGRSMLAYSEIAIRQGNIRIPKGTVVPMSQIINSSDDRVLVICTGGQGEPGSALQRMADGEHKYIKLVSGDTVIISSNPIPGNEVRYQNISNELATQGVHLFRNMSHEVDGCGPLHVGGHARRDEHREMIQLIRPKYFIPIYAGALNRKYHAEVAIEEGIPRSNVIQINNGGSVFFGTDSAEIGDRVSAGSLFIDQSSSPVSSLVIKDRLLLSEDGILTIFLTIDSKSGNLVTDPDVISRGFIVMKDSEELMQLLKSGLKRAVKQRYKRISTDQFKLEIKDFVTHLLYEQTGQSPIVIPVVNLIRNTPVKKNKEEKPVLSNSSSSDQKRFQEMRVNLFTQNQKD